MAEVIPQKQHYYLSPSSSSSSDLSECEELKFLEGAPPFWRNPNNNNKRLSKQVSMCEIPRDIAWEKRRRQILHQERNKSIGGGHDNQDVVPADHDVTDEDLNELKGSIELGFGFKEEEGQKLCNTLPALDLYFAVNRQYLTSPMSSPGSNKSPGSVTSLGGRSSSFGSPISTDPADAWKICSPGDDPQQVKTKLRHWARAVACSVKQSY